MSEARETGNPIHFWREYKMTPLWEILAISNKMTCAFILSPCYPASMTDPPFILEVNIPPTI